jgi:hypothetical protein
MQEEMKALHKEKTWNFVKLPNRKKVVGYKGCSLSSIRLVVLWNDTRQDLLQKVLHKLMGLTMRKYLLQ